MKLKIAIVAQGRFHAFDLARELIRLGNEVTVFTNYPRWAARRFGIPPERCRSFWVHGVLSRAVDRLPLRWTAAAERPLHRMFGRWAAKQLRRQHWQIAHLWSGVAEESLKIKNPPWDVSILMRGSAHIRAQAEILEQEEQRVKIPLDRLSRWMIEREEREYALSDRICVLSTFARRSFIEQGVDEQKLFLLPLGVQTAHFQPPPSVVEERTRRISAGEPLRVLYVGALSFQKGFWDLKTTAHSLGSTRFRFRLVGPRMAETKGLIRGLRPLAKSFGKVTQSELKEHYQWADLFIFPTLQDGFAMVLTQAQAAGLPILSTTHCAGPDLIREGVTGWVFPIRTPEAFIERLRWCDLHREELSAMVRRSCRDDHVRDWADVAADFESICGESLKKFSGRSFSEDSSG